MRAQLVFFSLKKIIFFSVVPKFPDLALCSGFGGTGNGASHTLIFFIQTFYRGVTGAPDSTGSVLFFLSFFLRALPRWPKPALNLPSFCLSLSNRWDYRPETSIQTCYFFWSGNTFLKCFSFQVDCYYLFYSAETTVWSGWMWCWPQPPGPLLFPVLLTTICISGSSQKLWHGPAAPFSSFSVT